MLNEKVSPDDFKEAGRTELDIIDDNYYWLILNIENKYHLHVNDLLTGYTDQAGNRIRDIETGVRVLSNANYYILMGNFDGRNFDGTYLELINHVIENANMVYNDFEYKNEKSKKLSKQTGRYHTTIWNGENWEVTDKYSKGA